MHIFLLIGFWIVNVHKVLDPQSSGIYPTANDKKAQIKEYHADVYLPLDRGAHLLM